MGSTPIKWWVGQLSLTHVTTWHTRGVSSPTFMPSGQSHLCSTSSVSSSAVQGVHSLVLYLVGDRASSLIPLTSEPVLPTAKGGKLQKRREDSSPLPTRLLADEGLINHILHMYYQDWLIICAPINRISPTVLPR